MKTKLVLWGKDDQEEKVLMAIQLRAEDNQVDVWTFHGENASGDVYKQLMYEWREGKEMAFPENGYNHHEGELSATGRLLPENVFPEKEELIERAKTEWHFVVLSSKLNEVYQIELAELKEEVEALENYSSEKWDKLKLFWDKVREQMQENNLARDHANSLKRQVNGLFSYLKDLRSAKEAEFQSNSATTYDKFKKSLEDVNARIKKGEMLHLVFEELKSIQRDFRGTQLTREDRAKLWPMIDGAFKAVKEIRFGPAAGEGNSGNSPIDRNQHRLNGLMEAITKMERSIKRDKEELTAQERKKGSSRIGQLESQLLDAKINIIQSRCKSKEDKLANMHKTREEVEKKLAQAKRCTEEKAERAKAAKEKAAAAPVVEEKVEAIKEKATEVADTVENKVEAAKEKAEEVAETVENKVVDTKEKVADTVGSKVEAAKEKAAEVAETVENKVADTKEKVADTVENKVEVAKEKAAEVAETVENKVADTKEKVADTVENKVEAAKEKAAEVAETVENKVADTKAKVADTVENKVEAVKEKAAEVAETVEEKVEATKAVAKEKIEQLAMVAEEKVEYEISGEETLPDDIAEDVKASGEEE